MSSFSKISHELKFNILQDYLSGMDVKDIATKYEFKHARTVYFHLKPLSLESKVTHLRNKQKGGES